MSHTIKGFSIVNEAEVDIFLEFPCFLYDPRNIVNLISGSSAFSKFSLYIWEFSAHLLLKPVLKDFQHNHSNMWKECNCTVDRTFFGIALHWNWSENWLFQSCGFCWVFPKCWHIECSTLTASSFRIWNSSTGISPSILPLFVVMFPKTHLTSFSGCLPLSSLLAQK